MAERRPTFLGRLCARGHDHEETGHSLRYVERGRCVQCLAAKQRRNAARRKSRLQSLVVAGELPRTHLGPLCHRGHDHEGMGLSLRYTRDSGCVACRYEDNRAFALANPDRVREHQARFFARRGPKPAARRERALAYAKTTQAVRARRLWYVRTRPARLAYARIAQAARRARLAAVVQVPYSAHDVTHLFSIFADCCAYCGAMATTVDHVVPIIGGGHDALYNLVTACIACNSGKKDRSVDDWYPRQPFYQQARMDFLIETLDAAWAALMATAS